MLNCLEFHTNRILREKGRSRACASKVKGHFVWAMKWDAAGWDVREQLWAIFMTM